jgi:hypothetical protein
MSRVSRSAPPTPSTTPPSTGRIPWRITSRRTSPGFAPRAIRIPISRVRRAIA